MPKLVRNSFLFLFLLVAAVSYSQELKFSRITNEDGLSQSTVHAIVEDEEGFMWFGTQDGLNRYNGYEIKVFKNNPEDSTTLSENNIQSLFLDSDGVLWIGTSGGINVYNKYTSKFKRIGVKNGLISEQITSISQDNSGVIWVGTKQGLSFYDKLNSKAVFLKTADNENIQLDVEITALEFDGKNTMLIGTNGNGFYIYNTETKTLDNILFPEFDEIKFNPYRNKIKTFYFTSYGVLLIGTNGAGYVEYDLAGKKILHHYFQTDVNPNSLSHGVVSGFVEPEVGSLWVTTSNRLSVLKQGWGDQFIRYAYSDCNEFSLSENNLSCVYKSSSGIVWIGTNGGGVSIFKKLSNNQFNHFTSSNFANGCLNHNMIMAIEESDNHELWIGTFGGGVVRFDAKTNECIGYPFAQNKIHDRILSLFIDDENLLWIGSNGSGINYFDPTTNKFSSPFDSQTKLNGTSISQNDVLDITQDNEGLIWIGTLRGLNSFDKKKKEFTNYYKEDGLIHNFINALYFDKEFNKLWIATTKGVSCFDKSTNKFTNYVAEEGKESISNNYAFCFHKDKKNNLWIGTAQGLNKINLITGKITYYLQSDGLSNDYIYGILEDEEGYLWLTTNKGLLKIKPPDDKNGVTNIKTYLEQDGIQSNEFNQGAYFKSKSSQLFFGGINGFNAFYPKNIKENKIKPKICLTSFKLFDKEVELDSNITFKNNIELTYKDRFFSFEFVALDFEQPSKNMYSWKLEGLEEEWRAPTNRRYASYNNLPGGDYVLRIRASNNDGYWNEEGISIKITVIPPFYKTKWFYAVCVILIIIGVLLFVRLRTNQIKKEKIVLEKKVRERTRELNEKNNEIISSIQYAKRIQEAILPPMDLIQKSFPNSFILYEPKDIVSGDFYWFGVKDEFKIIAAVDCTGHGVPGALMSMIGHNLLNQIVFEKGITQADEILKALDELVRNSLKQVSGSSLDTTDGMDLALCVYNENTSKLYFSGAFRPLYHIRSGELNTFDGDKYPIGGGRHMDKKQFTTKEIEIQKGDSVYIFSDGYVDQFGGPKGKKFMAKKLRDLLLEIQNEPMQSQYNQLKQNLVQWMGNLEQIDDVLVVGLKF